MVMYILQKKSIGTQTSYPYFSRYVVTVQLSSRSTVQFVIIYNEEPGTVGVETGLHRDLKASGRASCTGVLFVFQLILLNNSLFHPFMFNFFCIPLFLFEFLKTSKYLFVFFLQIESIQQARFERYPYSYLQSRWCLNLAAEFPCNKVFKNFRFFKFLCTQKECFIF